MESGSKAVSSDADEAVRSPVPAVTARDEDVEAVSPRAPAATPNTLPYYGCVFCKRGFTRAQALGGHMNIHRRDRAKPAARVDAPAGVTSVSSRNSGCNSQYRHLAYPPAPPATATTSRGSSSSFTMSYYPGAAAAAGVDTEAVSPGSPIPRELSLFVADTRDHDHELHLGLGCYGRGGNGSRSPEGSEQHDGEPERKLDLELRLGRRPRH